MRQYLTRPEAAQYLTERGFITSKNTLQKKATTGGGPAYYIFGNRALYTAQTLDDYAKAMLSGPRRSKSEAT